MNESARKQRIRAEADALAAERETWIERNAYYYDEDYNYTRFLIPPGARILDLGCGTGRLLASLRPASGIGVDLSPKMVEEARRRHPELEFRVGDIEDPAVLDSLPGPFDVILLSDTVGSLEDCATALRQLHRLCHADTRVVIAYYSRLWSPVLRVAQLLGQQMPQAETNWLSAADLAGLLFLTDFEVLRTDYRQILPKRMWGLGPVANRFLGPLPVVSRIGLRSYAVARPLGHPRPESPSVTVVVPARNEAGNIAPAVERIPRLCDDVEILFVEGHSQDETVTAIEKVIADNPELDIKLVHQDGIGKADAIRKGFGKARGDLLMILDADLTTPPEDLPKFYDALASGKGELVMGTRLVYAMEDDAMQMLNIAANKVFSWLFSWLLNQHITDTLCGTKALSAAHYRQIEAGREYFGDFDPFGDFDLIFGAAKLNLRIVEIPVRYRARQYGSTQISRFRHGWLLARMVAVAYRRLKAVQPVKGAWNEP
jgi:SAM-dependent methyltransferase